MNGLVLFVIVLLGVALGLETGSPGILRDALFVAKHWLPTLKALRDVAGNIH